MKTAEEILKFLYSRIAELSAEQDIEYSRRHYQRCADLRIEIRTLGFIIDCIVKEADDEQEG